MKKIALLGSTGYIGRSLLHEFFREKNEYELFLFSRSKDKIKDLVNDAPRGCKFSIHSYDEFPLFDYDVVVNCTGIKSLLSLKQNPSEVFEVTEEIDNMVLGYLGKKPKALYINLSSGAVYGSNIEKPITSETRSILNINDVGYSEYYSIAKINAEAKHRSMPDLNIVDLRVFAFFSRFADVSQNFLMSEIAECIKKKKVFVTNGENIVRDYISPEDLLSLIRAVMKKQKINDFFDTYSVKPVSKFELLSFLEKKYGLKYSIKKSQKRGTETLKSVYCSKNKKAKNIGYVPRHTSLRGIECEIDKMLALN